MKTLRKALCRLLSSAVIAAAAVSLNAQNTDYKREVNEVQTDFKIPFWRNTDKAEVTVCLPQGFTLPAKASIAIRTLGSEAPLATQEFDLKAGWNDYTIDISGIDAGRFFADITIGGEVYRRMLRVERYDETCLPAGPVATKTIMFTPDDYLFVKSRNIDIDVTQAKINTVHRAVDNGCFGVTGTQILKKKGGDWYVQTIDSPYKRYQLVCDIRNDIFYTAKTPDGPWTRIDTLPEGEYEHQKDVLKDYSIYAGFLKDKKYPLYDPAVHGTYTLKDVRLLRHMFGEADYGLGPVGERTYWSMAYTSSGDTVFLSTKPFIQDFPFYEGDLFDNGFMTNDNFGSSWFSADGRTLYHAHGQTVRRFDPYFVHYDNLLNCERYITIYSTTDGIDWKCEHIITVESEPFEQQYWVQVSFIPSADIYIAYVKNYSARTGTTHITLKYSHDGLVFHNFPGNPPFAIDDYPGDFWGEIYVGPNLFTADKWPDGDYIQSYLYEYGNNYYQACEGSALQHFSADVYFRRESFDDVTIDDLNAAFEGRDFDSMPYLEMMGGREGVVDRIKTGGFSAGTISFRADGWFYAAAGSKAGSFTTRPIGGGCALSANATIGAGGWLKASLFNESGRKVCKACLREGDALDLPLFEMPEGSCTVKVRMKNCRLFAFNRGGR
ncbi:MAG: hypothetical protein KBT44_05070 [Bacteroidales bacterium]|nr:hypothetical protein [Candidatus Equibacterium intestinale]